MTGTTLFALVALLPTAITAGPPTVGATLVVSLCSGDSAVRTISIPVQRAPAGPATDGDCHPKGCHVVNSRKRTACHI